MGIVFNKKKNKDHINYHKRIGPKNFKELVWPAISRLLGGGRILSVEEESDSGLKKELDKAGIDCIQVRSEAGTRAIGYRLKYRKNWQAFDIRISSRGSDNSQLLKMFRGLNEGNDSLLPNLNIQAYLTATEGGQLVEVGIVELVPFAQYVADHHKELKTITNYSSGGGDSNPFIVVPWKDLIAAGIEVKIISGSAQKREEKDEVKEDTKRVIALDQPTIFKPWDIAEEKIVTPPQFLCDVKGRRFVLLASFFVSVQSDPASNRLYSRKFEAPKPWPIKLHTPDESLVFYVPYLQICKIITQRLLEQYSEVPKHFRNCKVSIPFDYPMLLPYLAFGIING